MCQSERLARPTAAQVLELITTPDDVDPSATAFCGVCCMPDDATDSADSLAEEKTVLPAHTKRFGSSVATPKVPRVTENSVIIRQPLESTLSSNLENNPGPASDTVYLQSPPTSTPPAPTPTRTTPDDQEVSDPIVLVRSPSSFSVKDPEEEHLINNHEPSNNAYESTPPPVIQKQASPQLATSTNFDAEAEEPGNEPSERDADPSPSGARILKASSGHPLEPSPALEPLLPAEDPLGADGAPSLLTKVSKKR